MDSSLVAITLALAAAAAWGSGDFTGGQAARRVEPLRAVLIDYGVGLIVLLIVALALAEPIPPLADLTWGALAGLAGLVGILFLFRGFVAGQMGIVAPMSAVLTAAIPVAFNALTEGLPGGVRLAGFGCALAGVWLLSRPEGMGGRPEGLGLAVLAGVGFAGFFIALGQVGDTAVFWPLVAGRVSACGVLGAYMLTTRRPVLTRETPLSLLTAAGLLDAVGNLFFLLAMQLGRLDVTAMLGSLYPAFTTLLAWIVLRERLTRLQMGGVGAALVAIVLITV